MTNRIRMGLGALALSAAGLVGILSHEGFTSSAVGGWSALAGLFKALFHSGG